FLRSIGRIALGSCVVVTFIDRIGHPAVVQGSSMVPTLEGASASFWERDVIWLSTLYLSPQLGDVMTFTYYSSSPRNHSKVLIKRVTSLEGGLVRRKPNSELLIVPEGHCWMESDNGKNANDSNRFGPVSYGLVQARATYIIWPPHRWSQIK
ncbi:hypothetical protein PFISCL1PPCAC_15480, partial [Pristionchus fissidentatus]